jgi:hypothetical protein
MIHVGTFFDEELAELPMSVKGSTVEIEVFSERLQCFPVGEQEPNGADITVVYA